MESPMRFVVPSGWVLVVAFPFLVVPRPAAAQEHDPRSLSPMEIPRLSGPIEVDGVVDEAAWEEIDPLPMTMFAPTFGEPVTERTEVRIAHDDEYLYVSGRLFDSDPSGIRTNTFYRNQYSGDDLLAVVIDSYNDHETALWFTTNPAGARTDRTVSNDAVFSGGMPMNWDWNAHWDVETVQTDEGWFAEFRIPFSTLGFQVRDGTVTMGLIVYRFIARKNERQIFPAINPRWGGLAFAKPSQARRVVMRGVRQSTPLYVTPYTLGGVNRIPDQVESPEGGAVWRTESDPTTEVGLDVQYAPVSNLTLDLTLNTDFAQVEADDQQINLSRFPLFFPEKRQFFQERASTFQFNTGGSSNRLFHSRRIGLDDGEIVRIYGGGRAVGRVGGTDFGLLSMQVASGRGSSSENMSVLRVSQEVLNPYSSIGGMLTSRLGSGAGDNIAYGLDGVLRPMGDEWLTLRWAQSFDEVVDERSFGESGLFLARWERIRDDGLSYSGEFIRVGEDYHPGLGFQDRRGFRFGGGHLQYKRFRDAASPFRSLAARINTGHFVRSEDGSAESRTIAPELSAEFKGGTELRATLNSRFESLRTHALIAGVEVPSGEYWFHEGEVRLQLPRSNLFRGDFTATAGSFFDGTRVGVALNPTWTQSRYLELGGGYELNRLEFSDRDISTTAHLAQLRVQVALNTRISLSTLAQYSNAADLGTVNARFRYHFREGTDLWVVYNEGFNTDRGPLDPARPPLSAGRTLMVKYTHTFIM
jgi:hypothetical protein